jgi:rhodanese-related sulfurtransferase
MNKLFREGAMTGLFFRSLLISLLAAGFCLHGSVADAGGWKIVEPQALHGWMKTDKVVLINVMSRIECLDHRIPGSLCIACEEFEKRLSEVPRDVKVILYCESESCTRSCNAGEVAVRNGLTNIYVLTGGMPAWKKAGYTLESLQRIERVPVRSVKAQELEHWRGSHQDTLILDIRSEAAYAGNSLPGAVNIPFYQLHKRYGELPERRPLLIVDDQGFRSFLAGSYLYRKGFHDINRLFGGMNAVKAAQGKKQEK